MTNRPCQREDFGCLIVAYVEIVVDAIVRAERQKRSADVFDQFGLGGLGLGWRRGLLVGCGLRGTEGNAKKECESAHAMASRHGFDLIFLGGCGCREYKSPGLKLVDRVYWGFGLRPLIPSPWREAWCDRF